VRRFPSPERAVKHKQTLSGANELLESTITVPADQYGVVYKLWVDIDVGSEVDLGNCTPLLAISVAVGSTTFTQNIPCYIEHTDGGSDVHRYINLGPWFFDFGDDGFYSGVLGEDISVQVTAAGTGIKAKVNYLYSGD